MKNVAKFFAGWLVIAVTVLILVVPFTAGGFAVGMICAVFLLPQICLAMLGRK